MWQVWLIGAGVFFIAEIITVGFLIFWLGIGALITMVVSFFTDNLLVQTSVFVFSSSLLILATKPFLKKFIPNHNTIQTNVYSIIGKTAIVTENINSLAATGKIKINGETWSALGKDDCNIEKGTEVKILEIRGVKTVVAPCESVSKVN